MNPEFHAYALSAPEISLLLLSTAGVAIIHTLSGPDHYLPFIVMARARQWSTRRTVWLTLLCGLGHVGSSLVLAAAGVVFGFGLQRIQFIEGFRGNLAAWALIAFGAVYGAWGLKRALRSRTHEHGHEHPSAVQHAHPHPHTGEHAHAHTEASKTNLTPWVLFTVFVFGPCEPMIPLVLYPAAQGSWRDVWIVAVLFSALTLLSMVAAVFFGLKGSALLPMGKLERYSHALAGGTILLTGGAIQLLGL